MEDRFGDLRGLLQKKPSREIFQRIVFLYPDGQFPEPELEYAFGHLESWPKAIRRTFPRSWFDEASESFANGLLLCNHVMFGLGESEDPEFLWLDTAIIRALVDHEHLPTIRTLTMTDEFSPEPQTELDCNILRYAKGLKNLECVEIHATWGMKNLGGLLLNKNLSNLNTFKVCLDSAQARSIAKNARRSAWFRGLKHFELKFEYSRTEEYEDISDLLKWILSGEDFQNLESLGINIDSCFDNENHIDLSHSPVFRQLKRLAFQQRKSHESNEGSLISADYLQNLEELVFEGCFINMGDANHINNMIQQLSSLKFYNVSFGEDGDEYSALQKIIYHRGELDHLVISDCKFEFPYTHDFYAYENSMLDRGIKVRDTVHVSCNMDDQLIYVLDLSECRVLHLGSATDLKAYNILPDSNRAKNRELYLKKASFEDSCWENLASLLEEHQILTLDISGNYHSDKAKEVFSNKVFSNVENFICSEIECYPLARDEKGCLILDVYHMLCQLLLLYIRNIYEKSDNEHIMKIISDNINFNSTNLIEVAKASTSILSILKGQLGDDYDLSGFKPSGMKHLDLSHNLIGNAGYSFVCLMSAFGLNSLNLSSNNINFLKDGSFKNTSIKSMDLSYNPGFDEKTESKNIVDCIPDTLEFINLTGTNISQEDAIALIEAYPMLDVKIDYLPRGAGISRSISPLMRRRIFTEQDGKVDVFSWSTAPTVLELGRVASPPGVGHTDPFMEDAFRDINRRLSIRPTLQPSPHTWRDVLAHAPDGWGDIIDRLLLRGFPIPTDTGGELMSDGLTTTTRYVLGWCRPEPDRDVVLVDGRALDAALSYDEIVVSASLEDEATISEAIGLLEQMLSGRSV